MQVNNLVCIYGSVARSMLRNERGLRYLARDWLVSQAFEGTLPQHVSLVTGPQLLGRQPE